MELNVLKNKLNEFIENEKLNKLENQDEQNVLISKIIKEIRRLLKDYDLNCYIMSIKNHIYLTDNYINPKNVSLVDITVRFKKGNTHTRYYYKQCYYINQIEVKGKLEGINSIEDVMETFKKFRINEQQIESSQIEELKKFLDTHNITLDEMNKYTDLFKKYKFRLYKSNI